MDKTNKTYNWNELKDLLPEHHPKESIWGSISEALDMPETTLDFSQYKDKLPEHEPSPALWDNISDAISTPEPTFDFNKLKDDLPSHQPSDKLWNNISASLDTPTPTFKFEDYKNQLSEHTPDESIWEGIEADLEITGGVDQLPSHNPPENIWDQIEGELEEVKGGISVIRSAILIGLSMLFIIGAAIMLNTEEGTQIDIEQNLAPTLEAEPMMFASNEVIKVEWSDDEDLKLIQEMCQDYMAVCKQPQFKKLESELIELNEHKHELLEMVSEFDEESSYGPMLAKIENQKTALMKEMISMI